VNLCAHTHLPAKLIFVGPEKSEIQSLSIPLHQIMSSKFEQPMFGANYLVLGIAPSPEGGLTRGTTAEVRFKEEALFGFVRTLEKTREHAIETRHNNQAAADEADGLRTCSLSPLGHGSADLLRTAAYSSGQGASSSSAPPAASAASPTFSGAPPPPPNEAPPGYDA
jgi:hypothetical protein